MPLLPLVLLAPILILVAWSDLRHMRIPNALSLAAAALFLVSLLYAPPADLLGRGLVAASIFAVGFAAFCFRAIGGGDVKLLTVLILFVPLPLLPLFGLLFSASLIAGIALVLGLRQVPSARATTWQSMAPGHRFPMGVSIALSGLLLPPAIVMLG